MPDTPQNVSDTWAETARTYQSASTSWMWVAILIGAAVLWDLYRGKGWAK